MKKVDMMELGVHEMDTLEMKATNGGIILLVVLVTALLCASCSFDTHTQVGGSNEDGNDTRK